MADAVLAFQNHVTAAATTLTVSSAATGLDAGQLENQHGASSTAWQTAAGVTSASLTINSGSTSSKWRAFCLAGTNLTSGATVRWRTGNSEAFFEAARSYDYEPAPGVAIPAGGVFTRASTGWSFDANGLLVSTAANLPRYYFDPADGTMRGMLIEQARANRLLWSRDMTNAAWVKTNCTAALTATGIDGVANSASTITVTTGVASVAQTITLSSLARIFSIYVKRVSGSGDILISINGTNYQSVAPTSTEWQRVSISATVTNPVVTLRMTNTGDVFAFDCAQIEDSTAATTPIITTSATVTRSPDELNVTGSLFGATQGTMYAAIRNIGMAGITSARARNSAGTDYIELRTQASSVAADLIVRTASTTVYDGPNTSAGALAPLNRMLAKWVNGNSANARAEGWLNGGQMGDYAGLINQPDRVQVFCSSTGGVLSRLTTYTTALSDGRTVALTANNPFSSLHGTTFDSGVLSNTVAAGYGQSTVVAPAEVTGQYAVVDIVDPTNPDANLNIPLAFAGPALQPGIGLSSQTRNARERDKVVVRSRGGQEYVTLRNQRRRWTIDFAALSTSEYWDGIAEMERIAADGSNVLLVPFPSGDNTPREAIYGRLSSTSEAAWPFPNEAGLRQWSGTISQRL
jgi:hypothetical protein